MILAITLYISIGYASINSVLLDIKGSSTAKSQDGIFITDVIYINDILNTNMQVNTYYKTILDGRVVLEQKEDSLVTFKVNVYNSTDNEYVFKGIEYAQNLDDEFINAYDNENIVYECDKLDQVLKPGEIMTITTIFKYDDYTKLTENELNFLINYKFEFDTWKNITAYGFSQSEILSSQNQKSLSFHFTNVGGQYEKINIPLNNLIVGNLYQLTFDINLVDTSLIFLTNGNHKNLVYGCTVMDSPNTDYTSSNKKIGYDGYHSNWMWKEVEIKEETITISFIATKSTMYWVWDLSRVEDQEATLNIKNVKVEVTPKPSGIYVDLPNTTIYQIDFSKLSNPTYVTSISQDSFLIMSTYNEMILRIDAADDFEFINIPIVGLTSGKSYTISFNNYTESKKSNWNYGAKVQENKQEVGPQLVSSSDYLITDFSIVNSGEITFTATKSTMYLVWDCGGLQDGIWARITLSDINIKEN